MAMSQQTIPGDVIINGNLTVLGQVLQGNISNQLTQILGSVVTKQEADNGYNSTTGGTTTPTTPTVTAYPLYSSIAVQWDAQSDLRWLAYYQLQVSSDQTNWYSLRNDGVDWKGTLGAFTQVSSEYYSHKNIPFGGTYDNPTAVTLYYRVRRVTVSAVQGSWGQSNATTAPIPGGAIAAGAVTTAKVQISAITSSLIAAGAITSVKIGTSAVSAASISAGAVTTAKLAVGAVTATAIAAGAVTAVKLYAGSVTATAIAAGAVTAGKIAASAISSANIQGGTLNALIAAINTKLVVGPSGYAAYNLAGASPAVGDTRVVVTPTSVTVQQITALGNPNTVDNATWTQISAIGTLVGSIELGAMLARVFASETANLSDIAGDPLPDSSARLFSFDSIYADQYGVDPWTTKTNSAFSTSVFKIGNASVGSSSAAAELTLKTGGLVDFTHPFTIGVWKYISGALLYGDEIGPDDGTSYCTAQLQYGTQYTPRLNFFNDAGASFQINLSPQSLDGTANAWHFLAMTWDPATNTMTGIVDNYAASVVATGTFSKTAVPLVLDGGPPYSSGSCYFDDLIFDNTTAVAASALIAHGNNSLPWVSIMLAGDILLRPGPSGQTKIDMLDGGGPTPIVASGSNANGSYVRFADGTMEQWGNITFPLSAASFYSGTGNYPAPWATIPTGAMTGMTYYSGFNAGGCSSSILQWNITDFQWGLNFGAGQASGYNGVMHWHAIGKWK